MDFIFNQKTIKLHHTLSDKTVKNIIIKILNHPNVKHAHAYMHGWEYHLCIIFEGAPVTGLVEEHYLACNQIPVPHKTIFIGG